MATSRGKQYVREVNLVERQPSKSKSSNIAPSTPPSSPKAVRFAPSKSDVVTSVSRGLTSREAWSLYHFECHAQRCPRCHDPFHVFLKRGQLCETGHALAQDVALHVYYTAGEIYSTEKDNHKLVRVELEPGYFETRSLLKGMDHQLRSAIRPTISYDKSYPVASRRTESQRELEYNDGRKEVIIEPADSRESKRSGRKSKHKSTRKTTVVQDHDSELDTTRSQEANKPRERRGSLYYSDRQRKPKEYHVEERKPQWERSDQDERRKSGYFA